MSRCYRAFAWIMPCFLMLALCGCSPMKLDDYAEEKPTFDMKDYFNGPIKAWGIVQNPFGKIVNRFDLQMHASWSGNQGKLQEYFTFYDGKKQERVWRIAEDDSTHFRAYADDIKGTATGTISGNAVLWNYTMAVPVKGKTYHFHFDDWMWQMNDGILMNRSYMKKWGITVAELTIVMQKQR